MVAVGAVCGEEAPAGAQPVDQAEERAGKERKGREQREAGDGEEKLEERLGKGAEALGGGGDGQRLVQHGRADRERTEAYGEERAEP